MGGLIDKVIRDKGEGHVRSNLLLIRYGMSAGHLAVEGNEYGERRKKNRLRYLSY